MSDSLEAAIRKGGVPSILAAILLLSGAFGGQLIWRDSGYSQVSDDLSKVSLAIARLEERSNQVQGLLELWKETERDVGALQTSSRSNTNDIERHRTMIDDLLRDVQYLKAEETIRP